MPEFTDDMGNHIQLSDHPTRIISTVPSQTELLFSLGLGDKIIGRTKFCIHPKKMINKVERIGGTKTLNIAKIKSLQPDLIIANKEENTQTQIEELQRDYPVYISDVKNLTACIHLIKNIGAMTGAISKSLEIINRIDQKLLKFEKFENKLCDAAYLIWYNPWMTVGKDSFIHSMMELAGFSNVFHHLKRYPIINLDQLKEKDPNYVLLSSEPFPFKEKHRTILSSHLQNSIILDVDGEAFSWYGSRILSSLDYFFDLKEKLNQPR